MSWIVSLPCTRAEAEALSGDIPELDAMPEAPVVVTREIDENAGLWQLDAYMDAKPGADLVKLLQSFLPSAQGRKPDVMADAAYAIFNRDARSCTGNFFIDDEVLYQEGVRDFDAYRIDPSKPLRPDLFLPADSTPPPGVQLGARV